MSFLGDPRRRSVLLLAGGVLLLFALLGALQAFNMSEFRFFNPETSGETLAFVGLIVLVFLLLMLLLTLLFRNILKLYADQSGSALGARLRTRLVVGAALIALIPAVCMFLFSFLLMNRSIDRWFSQPTSDLREDANRVVLELAQYATGDARVESQSIATSGALDADQAEIQALLASHRITLEGGFAVVFDKDHHIIAGFENPSESSQASLIAWMNDSDTGDDLLHGTLSDILFPAAQRSDETMLRVAGREYALGMAANASGRVVVVALPVPQGLSQTTAHIRSDAAEYRQLVRSRVRVRITFVLMLLLITVFVFFSSVWVALFLSKQITRPVEALAEAMDEIAAGKYEHRVSTLATGEMADLIRSFNHMAADLDASRQLAETSQAQLTTANRAVEERRRELETIVETIPSGVVTLDGAGLVLQSNRAFAALMGLNDDVILAGKSIRSFFPDECADDLNGVIRRGSRMGAAYTEVEFHARGRTVHLTVTSARLDLGRGKTGSVLVVEDTTEVLRAQRQMAWKEVAQQVAHEIKNPLTPIALSAERIGRHLDRGQPDSPKIIRKCSEVILGCVGTLRTLVDQFAALAQFPAPQPRPCDMNQIAEEALALFGGRLEGITVQRHLEPGLPPVLADPEAIRRALANLIDNAAEAMQGSLLRVLAVQTSLSEEADAVEVVVSDTGPGLTDEIRERLFLPFYSTKHRGTGLGLSIAAKIAQEHGGTISAEANTPKGARFLLRLPVMEPSAEPESAAGPETVKGLAS
jgi:two-component system, NtrC family, nitrogen regulation sensor histidine kinase NtrY